MIDREDAIQKMHQVLSRAKDMHKSDGLSYTMALAYDYRIQSYAECINDVNAYELAFHMSRELREMTA